MTKAEKRKHCVGCNDDLYNGANPYGIKECWNLKSARLILKKEVHIDQVPPWNQEAKEFLNCFKKPRYDYIEEDQTR